MVNNTYSILVNTCDKFEDCWNPFFKLFKKYWPDFTGVIYLNTEYKDYTYEGLNVVALKVCKNQQDAHKITWSECLKRALESIESDIVLYMQEDYFLKGIVNNNLVEKYYTLICEMPDIHCIHVTDQALLSTNEACSYEGLKLAKLKQRYRVSCQAALWRKDVFLSYIRTYENAWQFEEFGSRRGAILKHNFYVVDNNWIKLNEFEIIPYVFTGIVQGRWYEEVIELFKSNYIIIDYSKRGFLKDRLPKTLLDKIKYKLLLMPIIIRNIPDFIKYKFN